MYYTVSMQKSDGTFVTLDTTETYNDAIASAKCEVNGKPNGYAVYVFYDQTYMGKTYPYLVAKVSWQSDRFYTGPIVGLA